MAQHLSLRLVVVPPWLHCLSRRPSVFWNIGFGLIIGLSLLRWLLRR